MERAFLAQHRGGPSRHKISASSAYKFPQPESRPPMLACSSPPCNAGPLKEQGSWWVPWMGA